MGNRKRRAVVLMLIIFSFFVIGCKNPLIIQVLGSKTASFETNGGGSIESQTVYRDYPIKQPSNPSRDGYVFYAWYSDNGTFQQQWDFNAIPTADITLYAKWIPGEETGEPGKEYTVTFNLNYSGAPASETQTVFFGENITSITPTPAQIPNFTAEEGLYLNPMPDKYQFDGWFKEPALTNKWDFDADVVFGNRTLYAKWTVPNRITTLAANNNVIWEAVNYVNNNAAAGSYTLLRNNNISAPSSSPNPMPTIDAQNFDLTIKGINRSTIKRNNGTGVNVNSPLFTINNDSAILTLEDNITLEGINNGTTSLVMVTKGKLVMETGSIITGHNNTGVLVNGGTFEMKGGTISGNGNTVSLDSGGGVYVNGGGTFTMNGNEATISGNFARYSGAGVYIVANGKFAMSSGKITENISLNSGGGVYSNGTFEMSGGEISGNIAENESGGGVSIGGGTFTMSGGEIKGNTANHGGGVYTSGTFNMNDGTISGNKTTGSSGGGVYVNNTGTFQISNGTVHGNENATAQNLRNNVPTGEVGAALYVSKGGDGNSDAGTAIYGNGLDIPLTLDSVPALGGFNYFGYANNTIIGQP